MKADMEDLQNLINDKDEDISDLQDKQEQWIAYADEEEQKYNALEEQYNYLHDILTQYGHNEAGEHYTEQYPDFEYDE